MVQCIRLNNKCRIDVSQDGKFMYENTKISIKEVPIIRIDFEEYNEELVEYIEGLSKVFMYSIIMLELHAERITDDSIAHLIDLSKRCAVYVYIDIDDSDIDGINSDKLDKIDNIMDKIDVDSISIVDKSTKLNSVTAAKLVEELSDTYGIELGQISICNSPLSCTGYACLTAVKARALMALYSSVDDVPLPTANHEKSCCGCIQYVNIEHDTDKIISSKHTERRDTKKISKKTGIRFGATRF